MNIIKKDFFIKNSDDNSVFRIDEIKDLFNTLNSYILVDFKNISSNLEELQKLFKVFFEKFKNEENEEYEKQKCLENINHKINIFLEQISEISVDQNILKIKELNNQLIDIINKKSNNEIEINDSNSSNLKNNQSYIKFCDKWRENLEENNNINDCITSHESIKFLCEEGSNFFCKNCYEKGKENEKKNFLSSLNTIIKSILIRSNILFNEEGLSFKYPSIGNINNFDSQIEYLKDINNILVNDFGQADINLNSFKISEMNEIILNSIKQNFNFENSFKEISNKSLLSLSDDDSEYKTIYNFQNLYEDYKAKYIVQENWASINQLKIILENPIYSICKINLSYFINEKFINGFFCNINVKKRKIPTLFTAYHNFDDLDILELLFYNNNIQKLNLKYKKRVIYSSKKNNISIIELEKNEIQNSFFELDESLIFLENINDFKQRKIYCLYYSDIINEFCFSIGLVQDVKKHALYHTCPINEFCKGAPIINFTNNKIIAINEENSKKSKIKKARLLKDSIKKFIRELN